MKDKNISDNTSDTKDEAIKQFVILNPYPSFDEMSKNIERRIDLEAEYGVSNHAWCKTIYDNPTNENLIVETGKAIYRMGGMQALSKNLEVIQCYSPYWNSSFTSQGSVIGKYFENANWKY